MKKIVFSILAFAAFSSIAQTKVKPIHNTKNSIYVPKIYLYSEVDVKPVCDTFITHLSLNISNSYWYDYSQRHRDIISYTDGKIRLKFKISLQINEDGSVSNVLVKDMNGVYDYSENYSELSSYVYNCQWKPGEVNGDKVNTLCSVDISFDVNAPQIVTILPESNNTVYVKKRGVETQSSYYFNIDFGANIINYGIIGTYKVSAKSSIIYSIKFGSMYSEYGNDIRTDDDKRCSSYSLGVVRHGNPTSLGYCFRYYLTCGLLSATPESDIKKFRRKYIVSNAGIIIDAPKFSYIFGMGGMPIYVNMGIGFNIKNKLK